MMRGVVLALAVVWMCLLISCTVPTEAEGRAFNLVEKCLASSEDKTRNEARAELKKLADKAASAAIIKHLARLEAKEGDFTLANMGRIVALTSMLRDFGEDGREAGLSYLQVSRDTIIRGFLIAALKQGSARGSGGSAQLAGS